MKRTTTLAALALTALGLAAPSKAAEPACEMSGDEGAWTQRALLAWERGSRDLLRTSPTPLPWIVLVGPRCAWHLAPDPDAASFPDEAAALDGAEVPDLLLTFAGAPVPVRAVVHGGTVRLPDGSTQKAGPAAGARLRRKGKATFFVMSTLEVWRAAYPEMPESDLEPFFLGVFSHEIVHTRQLVAVGEEIGRLVERYGIPPRMDDDIVENRMKKKRRYREAYEAERDLFFQAAAEPDPARAKELAARALGQAEARRARWLSGRRAWLGEMEPLFLAMEGVAEWCRFRLLADDPREPRTDAELLAMVRGKDNNWSQDEGLALFLLLDRLAPGWQERVLSGTPPSPLTMLAEAIRGSGGAASAWSPPAPSRRLGAPPSAPRAWRAWSPWDRE